MAIFSSNYSSAFPKRFLGPSRASGYSVLGDFAHIAIVMIWMSYIAQLSGLIGILVITTYNSWAP